MFDILFPMHQFDFHTKFLIQVLCQMLGRINRTMLSAGATEGEHQVGEAAVDVSLHVCVSELVYAVEEGEYLAVVLEESYHGLVESCEFLVRLIASGVVRRTAVEHVSSAIARLVGWYALAVGKAEDAHA